MKITIVDRQALFHVATKAKAYDKLLLCLARYESRIDRVRLRVADINGPRNGRQYEAILSVSLKKLPSVHVTWKDDRLSKCISKVCDRANRSIGRQLEKSRELLH